MTRRFSFALPLVAVALLTLGARAAAAKPAFTPEPAAGAAATAAQIPAGPAQPGDRTLSNERTETVWSFVREAVAARTAPAPAARVLRVLKPLTAFRSPELVLVLSDRREPDGSVWSRVRLPMRPNNTTAWIPRDALGDYRVVDTALRIDRGRYEARLYKAGRLVWRAPIGIGRHGWPTPAGHFYVRERLVPSDKSGVYGVFAFGTSAYSPTLSDWPGGGIIGMHGTDQPALIPGRISHGCIRVRNAKILRLRRLMPLGTPILIR